MNNKKLKNIINYFRRKKIFQKNGITSQLFVNSTNEEFLKTHDKEITALRCKISYNDYGGYCVPLSSFFRPAAQKILSNEVYEPQTIRYITSNYNGGSIVHAGTYFGDFLPALSKSVNNQGMVWAFEPNLENYRCAKITIEINNLNNVVLTHAALGATSGNSKLIVSDKNGKSLGGSSKIIRENSIGTEKVENVEIVRIDNIVDSKEKVSIIHLDIEGFEKEALLGGMNTIKKWHPIIILESLPEDQLIESDWFLKHIIGMGYKLSTKIYRNMIYSINKKKNF